MRKMLVLATMVAFALPVFAGDEHHGHKGTKHMNSSRAFVVQKDPQLKEKLEAKKAEMKAHKKQMKETEEKLETLVKQYKKAKEGSKKQTAARAEIEKILGQVRDQQIAFREAQIQKFEQRLAEMKVRLTEEKSAEMKDQWIKQMTLRVIEQDGDLKDALKHHRHMGQGAAEDESAFLSQKMGHRGPGPKGHFKGGPKAEGPEEAIPPALPEQK